MKKTVPFEVFGPNQFLMFDILRLSELEKAVGKTINELVTNGNAGVEFCLKALPIGMKQHYRPDPREYAERIEKHLENGGTLNQIEVPIIKAILASGIYGKQAVVRSEEAMAEATGEGAATEAKNEQEETA
jgi:hypothetical protein